MLFFADADELNLFVFEGAAVRSVRPNAKSLAPVKCPHVVAHLQSPALRLCLVRHPLEQVERIRAVAVDQGAEQVARVVDLLLV